MGSPQFNDWQQVNASGFRPPAENRAYASGMTVPGSYLYVGTSEGVNAHGGCDVFRSAGTGGPPFTDWQQVNPDGFAPNCNYAAQASAFFNGDYYVGTTSERDCQVWRYDGSSWAQVNPDGFKK